MKKTISIPVAAKYKFNEVTRGSGWVERLGKITHEWKTYYLEGRLTKQLEKLTKVKFVLWN